MALHLPLLLLLLFYPRKIHSQNDPTFISCPTDSNYTATSPFKADLDRVLSNLTASTPNSPALFSTTSYGAAYGLAQCRPDASPSDCANCLNRSVSVFPARCPFGRSSAVRFDLCLLRYSDTLFFSQVSDAYFTILVNSQNASDQTTFNRRLKDQLDEMLSEASSSAARFGAGVTNYSDFRNIYGLAQCTHDLSGGDCLQCLNRAVDILPKGTIGCQLLSLSCTIRYETQLFFSLSLVSPPPGPREPPPSLPLLPPSAPPPGNGTSGQSGGDKSKNTTTIILAAVIPSVAVVLLFFAICIYLRKWRPARKSTNGGDELELQSSESLLFYLDNIKDATNNFSDANKLGEGGFGPVYKGTLPDGQEIAVKRLARTSGQGLMELKNEVVLVAKLQHKNLVRLLGCCLEEQEKLLVYEYLPNTSLDKFLFDPERRKQLDWRRRYKIIEGIGRGLLYLHEDSRLRIIHRDLKASNILLDGNMNPKISDFGLAKLFDVDETQGNTSRIAGTYGYMAPEYAMHGLFSTKSDVYSYGVLVLEIVTGRKNIGFQESRSSVDLVGYVWRHWNEGTILQLKDQSLGDILPAEEVLRCIHIGLLCVQEDPTARPSMATVVLMLSSYSISLPKPSTPAFFIRNSTTSESDGLCKDTDPLWPENGNSNEDRRSRSRLLSANDISISEMDPR